MKTIYLSMLVGLGLIFFSTNEINAQKTTQTVEKNPGFIDKDGDGICDNYDGKRIGRGIGEGGGRRALYGDSLQYRNRRFVEGDSTTYYRGRKFNENDTLYYNHRRPKNPNYKRNPKNNYRQGNSDFQRRPHKARRMRDGTGPGCPNLKTNNEK